MDQQASKAPRPTRHDVEVLDEVAGKLVAEIIAHDGKDPGESLRVKRREELLGVLDDAAGDYDGYALARVLDDECHWSVDAHTVATLDMAVILIERAHQARTRAWVQAHPQEQRFAVGDRVAWTDGLTGKRSLGTIVRVRPETAEYVVRPEDWDGSKQGGWVLEFERVEAV